MVTVPGVSAAAAATAMSRLAAGVRIYGAAVGNPREKIRIEPVTTPVPDREPAPVPEPVVKEPA